MRYSESFPECERRHHAHGFTVLELVLALACSALLVAALVSVWILVIRATVSSGLETKNQRHKLEAQRHMQRLVSTLQWSPSSHLPQGNLPWAASNSTLVFWSRESMGAAPGPVSWTFSLKEGTWRGYWEAPAPLESDLRKGELTLEGLTELQLEILKEDVDTLGEKVDWTSLSNWDPARPFRPLGFRMRLKWDGDAHAVVLTGAL